MKKYVYILFICLTGILACKEIKKYSEIPEIHFKSFTYPDTSITFSFLDGDGDFGLRPSDTLAPYNDSINKFNLFITVYKKSQGKYSIFNFPINDPKLPPNQIVFRIENIPEPLGQNKTLKGDIKIGMVGWLEPQVTPDTFMFKFYIKDRALHKSNVDSTYDLYKKDIGRRY